MNQLKRDIGPVGLLFISFTAIFGSGWLFAPFFAAQIAGPGAMIAWVLGAVMAAVIGITMAEVIILFPKAGGLNTVIQMTHGTINGFLVNTLTLIVCIILPAIEVRAIIQYLSTHWSLLMTPDHTMTLIGYSFAGFLLLLINWINLYGVKYTARINSLSVVFKLITPITLCIFFIIALKQSGSFNHANLQAFMPIKWHEVMLAVSTSGIIFSFNGFNQATLFAAEAKNPQRSIPLAILGSIIISAFLYLLIQYVFLIALPKNAIANGWHALQFAGDNGPFSGLAVLLGLHWLLYMISVDAIISPLGTAFAYSSSGPRMFYALASNNNVLPLLQKLNHNGIPVYSVIVSMLLSFIAFILLPNLKVMISILVAAFVLNYTIAPISLLALRNAYPELPRAFKVPLPYVCCFLSLMFSNVMVYFCGYAALSNLIIVLFFTYVVACLLLLRNRRKLISAIKHSLWFMFQAIVLTILAYLNEKGAISFTSAMLAIFISCCLVMIFSLRASYNTLPEAAYGPR